MEPAAISATRTWDLPPVILHPFAEASGPDKLVESSRAHLMLQGLLPPGELTAEQLQERFLTGRFCEIRMLFYVGKDLERWVEQCVEFADRDPELAAAGVNAGSFIALLVEHAPGAVQDKLTQWGVADYRSIFRRAFGLRSLFQEAPARPQLSIDFIRFYYRFADQLYTTRLHLEESPALPPAQFRFNLFASGEYTRMLEREWESA